MAIPMAPSTAVLFDERFVRATHLLSSAEPTERIAGVTMLAGLGDRHPEGTSQCAELLCHYLRAKPAGCDAPKRRMEPGENAVRNAIAAALCRRLVLDASPSWSDTPLDFRGAIFGDHAIFDFARLTGPELFRGAVFTGVASFFGATFECRADVPDGEFDPEIDTRLCTAPDDINGLPPVPLGRSVREAVFRGAIFMGAANFASSTFLGDGNFSGTVFEDTADFTQARFHAHAAFVNTTFLGRALFHGCAVAQNLHFVITHFHQGIDLTAVQARDWLTFTHAKIDGTADLSLATIVQLSLDEAEFGGEVNLGHAEISYLEGTGVTFRQSVSAPYAAISRGHLRDSQFMGVVNFDDARIGEVADGEPETVSFAGTVFAADPVARLAEGSVTPDAPGVTQEGFSVTWRVRKQSEPKKRGRHE